MSQESAKSESALQRRRFMTMVGKASVVAIPSLFMARQAFGGTNPATNSPTFQNVLSFGADPTGNADSTSAFQQAFGALPGNGGTIYVPDGDFKLNSPLIFSGKAVMVLGNGEQSSRLFITHSGIALSFPQPSPLFMSSVKNLSISSVSSAAACAISITYPPFAVYGSQTALIENVAVPCQLYANFPNFLSGLQLMGCWQSVVRNFRHQGAGTSKSFFMSIGGRSIDIRITDCTGTNTDLGINLCSYTEGIHIKDTAVVSSNYCLSMFGPGFDQFEASQQYSTMGLTLTGCEMVANTGCLLLFRVLSGYISNCHFGLSPSAPDQTMVASLTDCQDVKISDSTISGNNAPTQAGIATWHNQYPCCFNQFNGNYYINLAYPVSFQNGSTGNTAMEIRWNRGGTTLSNSSPIFDNSGNSSNNGCWLNSVGHVVFAH